MTRKINCIGCKSTTITLEDTDEQNTLYGICSLCGFSYVIHIPIEVKNDN